MERRTAGPPPVSTSAYLPSWAVAAIVTATIVLSVATTLITMTVQRQLEDRRAMAGLEPETDPVGAEILTSRD